jgi:hypothetical protein
MRDDMSNEHNELERAMNLWGHALALRDNGIHGTPFEEWQPISVLCDRLWTRAAELLAKEAANVLDGATRGETT